MNTMTGTMDEKEGKTTSIHVKQNDARVARRYNYGDRGPGDFYGDAVKDMDRHRKLKKEKAQELQQRMDELLSEANEWGIEATGHVKQVEW